VQAYSFTSAPIAKALLDAHKRGVKILAVLDKSNETDKYSAATFLVKAGIQTLMRRPTRDRPQRDAVCYGGGGATGRVS
jgi:hypothetical protein